MRSEESSFDESATENWKVARKSFLVGGKREVLKRLAITDGNLVLNGGGGEKRGQSREGRDSEQR